MNQKNVVGDNELEIELDNKDIQIIYNNDFELDKTKSLKKFPLKNINNEFYLDDIYKNFSKSLNFNNHKCFAPKIKIKQSSRNPTPIIYEKQNDINNLNTQDEMISEDAYSEKELSLDNESSFSSNSENFSKEIDNNNKIFVNNDLIYKNKIINNNWSNNNKYIISKSLLENNSEKKSEGNIIDLKENKINAIEDKKDNSFSKIYEHKTITSFPIKNSYNENYAKGNIKAIRNSLFRAKMRNLKESNKETEYSIKNKLKIKYRLNFINNKLKKNDYNIDFYNVIPINEIKKEEEKDKKNENGDMNNLRKTISYNNSKLNIDKSKKIEGKGITIYDVLLTNNKNKKENKK